MHLDFDGPPELGQRKIESRRTVTGKVDGELAPEADETDGLKSVTQHNLVDGLFGQFGDRHVVHPAEHINKRTRPGHPA